jgi:hypothetical protein
MSKIKKWHNVRRLHEELVAAEPTWHEEKCGGLHLQHEKLGDITKLAAAWIRARRLELYRDLIAYSREQVLATAREALAECEQIREDAAMDVESIEEGQ